MPGLWAQREDSWVVVPIGHDPGSGQSRVTDSELCAQQRMQHGAYLLASGTGGSAVLIVGSGSGASVNGRPLPLGIRALRDKDEIFLSQVRTRLYYTAESPASRVAFPGGDRPIMCPRCTAEIEAGMQSVQCPACGVWHHATDEFPCWGYSQTCAGTGCAQHTSLSAGYSWTPEDL